MKLEIESERVLVLAKKCPQWRDGLVELFPRAFAEERVNPTDIQLTRSSDYQNAVAIIYNPGDATGILLGWIAREPIESKRKDCGEKIKLRDGLYFITFKS